MPDTPVPRACAPPLHAPSPPAGPRPRLKGRVRPEAFGGLLFCVEPVRILTLNPTAYRIAALLAEGHAPATIVAALAETFRQPLAVIATDVEAFLATLAAQDLLDRSPD